MNRLHHLRTWMRVAAGVICLSALAMLSLAEPPETPNREKANRLAELNLASLHDDRTRLPEMLQAISGDIYTTNIYDLETGLSAVARLGATEALPAIDAVIAKYSFPSEIGEAPQAYRARLVVEAESGQVSDKASAAQRQGVALAKMRGVLAELQIDAYKIKAAIAAYKQDKQRLYFQQWPMEYHALGQIADIAYLNGYKPDKADQDINALDFSPNPGASLKMKLAPLSRPQRINFLIEELSIKHSDGLSAMHEAQLLLNIGAEAAQAVAARIQDMDVHPDKYGPGAGTRDRLSIYRASKDGMIRVLENLGDNTQAPFIVRMRNEQAKREGSPLLTAKQIASNLPLDKRKRPIVYGY